MILDANTAQSILQQAGGDVDLARAMALTQGYAPFSVDAVLGFSTTSSDVLQNAVYGLPVEKITDAPTAQPGMGYQPVTQPPSEQPPAVAPPVTPPVPPPATPPAPEPTPIGWIGPPVEKVTNAPTANIGSGGMGHTPPESSQSVPPVPTPPPAQRVTSPVSDPISSGGGTNPNTPIAPGPPDPVPSPPSTSPGGGTVTMPPSSNIDLSNIGDPYTRSSSSSTSWSGLNPELLNIVKSTAPGLQNTAALDQSISNLMGLPQNLTGMGNNIASSWGGSWQKPLKFGA